MITENDIKPLIESSVRTQWADFASNHPRLAQVLSEPLLLAGVQQSLADDDDYQQAIEDAILIEAGLHAIGQVVGAAVKKWFEKLL